MINFFMEISFTLLRPGQQRWRQAVPSIRSAEEERRHQAIITTEPNKLTVSINHERMLVLLSDPSDFETWLSGSADEAFKLARSYAAEEMRIVQSGAERKDLLSKAA
jgi:putative SOS response-associated peptidase YedK